MMLVKRYDYKKLKRKNINGKRHYTVDGKPSVSPAPSVTTILSATAPPEDTAALKQWRKNVGYAYANQVTTEAANRGTRMHKYLERYMSTGEFPTPGSNPYAIQANLMAACVAQYGLMLVDEVWGTEVSLYHPDIYGGTTDCVGVHECQEAIVDFKQSNKIKPRWRYEGAFMQAAAYGEAHNELYGTNIRKGVIMMCTKDWEYQEFVVEGIMYDKYRKQWWRRVEEYYSQL